MMSCSATLGAHSSCSKLSFEVSAQGLMMVPLPSADQPPRDPPQHIQLVLAAARYFRSSSRAIAAAAGVVTPLGAAAVGGGVAAGRGRQLAARQAACQRLVERARRRVVALHGDMSIAHILQVGRLLFDGLSAYTRSTLARETPLLQSAKRQCNTHVGSAQHASRAAAQDQSAAWHR
jgi:hypothetical protein